MPDEICRAGSGAAVPVKRDASTAEIALALVPSIRMNQSDAPAPAAAEISAVGPDNLGSLSIRCMETMPSIAPRPCSRLDVMRATARIMFLKRAMVFLDQSVGFASFAR